MDRLTISFYYPRACPNLYMDLSLKYIKLFKDLTSRIGQEQSRQSSRLLPTSNPERTTTFDLLE